MAFWLVKTEPASWSWAQQVRDGTTAWDGVRNAEATRNLKAMRIGDRAFFYHSGGAREIVGIIEVVGEFVADPGDASGRFGMVEVRALSPLPQPASLAAIKADPRLQHLAVVRHPRLSVMPIDEASWEIVCAMGQMRR
jgi:predicted RNA-binding protein with PUA-like domain